MFREGMKDQKKMDDRILEALDNAAEDGLTDKELLAALDIKQSNGTYRKNRDLLVERGKALADKPEGAKGRRFWLAEHAPEQNLIGDLNGDV
jgi:chromosome segregation and condensation protein ScpB